MPDNVAAALVQRRAAARFPARVPFQHLAAENALNVLQQQPGAAITYSHLGRGGADRAGLFDQFQQTRLARPDIAGIANRNTQE